MSGTSQWCGGSTLLQRPDATTAIRPSATMVSTNLSVSPKQKWWLQSAKWLLYKNCIIILLWRENCFGPDEKREILANKSVIGWPNNLTCPACQAFKLPSHTSKFPEILEGALWALLANDSLFCVLVSKIKDQFCGFTDAVFFNIEDTWEWYLLPLS